MFIVPSGKVPPLTYTKIDRTEGIRHFEHIIIKEVVKYYNKVAIKITKQKLL